jgi:branched-chain amino acid transport system ATP-binding protein
MERGSIASDLRVNEYGWQQLLGRSAVARKASRLADSAATSGALKAERVTIRYRAFEAVSSASVAISSGSIACLVGTNGAGKSSILRAIVGLTPVTAGRIVLGNDELRGLAPHERVARGVVLVPSGRGLLPSLTVAETLLLAEQRAGALHRDQTPVLVAPFELFPELAAHRHQVAGTLSGGEQQMLAIARSLVLRPRFLLIDELSLGLQWKVVDRLLVVIRRLADAGLGLLVVEQDAPLALQFSDWAFVMNRGQIVFDGPSVEAAQRRDLFRPVFLAERD